MPDRIVRYAWPQWEWQVKATQAFYSQDLILGAPGDHPRGGSDSGLRFFVWNICRQYGKTALLQAVLAKELQERPGDYWFTAPQYDRAEEVYEEMCSAFRDLFRKKYAYHKATKAGWRIRFSWRYTAGGRNANIHFKSLGNAEHLRGSTLRGFVHDEGGMGEGKKYRTILIPMIRQLDGWSILCGTPPDPEEAPDPAFFRDCFRRGQGQDPKWWSIHRDYLSIPDARVRADIKADEEFTPAEEFKREYMAQFIEDEVFRLPHFIPFGSNSDVKVPPDGLQVFTSIDLADSEADLGSKAAVTTWGVGSTGTVWVLASEYYRNPSEVLDACYFHRSAYGSTAVKVQKSSFDKGFIHTVHAAGPTRGTLPMEETTIGGASKRRRILQMEPLARAGRFYVHDSLIEFHREWAEFPDDIRAIGGKGRRRGHHYDMLDAVAPCAEEALLRASWQKAEAKPMNTMAAALRALKGKKKGQPIDKYFRF